MLESLSIDVVAQLAKKRPADSLADPKEDALGRGFSEQSNAESEQRYRRLVENSDAIIFHSDADFKIGFISRRALDFFGVAPEDFVAHQGTRWFDFVHPDDHERVERYARENHRENRAFDDEFRAINRITGRTRWLLVRLVPVRGNDGGLVGWDGFGVDISSRRDAQDALDVQSKKVRALYTVSSAIRGYLDPANIASRGLATLCDATGADAGLCYLFRGTASKRLKLVSHHGFSAEFAERAEQSSRAPNLSTYVAEQSHSVVVPDLRNDPRASRVLSEEEGLRAAVLVPIIAEDRTLGTLALFSRETGRFHGGDVMLVGAAANQIGLAARQAKLFAAHRKQTKNLAALYRISHELSQNASLDDIFQQAFTIIRDELGLKRLWLGLLNETGSRIVGQSAYGPGWKRRLVEINVELSGREHPIARVVQQREPVVIDNPSEVLREFGVKRIFSRLEIHAVALVPLIASGQVLGVLAVQPSGDDGVFDEEDLNLLISLANEIAAIVLAKRLELRIAEGEKMRTAGLLAAGIAHNFNNLLQAILGQASLLEMQASDEDRVIHASKIINEAATKGAGLVKQLLSFAQLEEPSKEIVESNSLIERSVEGWVRFLDDKHELRLNLGDNLPRAVFDTSQFSRIVTSLIKNASEAMEEAGHVEVYTDAIEVDENAPHYEVPYGSYVRIGVRDNGKGMDEDTRRRCFEPFFTTQNVDPSTGIGMSGAGLGLAAAYALARRNGGRLVVDSRLGHGSVFTLYMPVLPEDSHRKELEGARKQRTFKPSQSMDSGLQLVDGESPDDKLEVEKIVIPEEEVRSDSGETVTDMLTGPDEDLL